MSALRQVGIMTIEALAVTPVKEITDKTDIGFEKAHEESGEEIQLPNKAQLRKGFEGLTDDRERALYLFYATTRLRCSEVLKLNRFQDIVYQLRAVKLNMILELRRLE